MTAMEMIARTLGYALAVLTVFAAAIWYGWELRERLAVKLEYFRITNRQWADYAEQLKANQGKVPLRGELHDMQTHRQSDQ